MNGDVAYSPPDYICRVCDYIVGTDTDIESDNDSDYQPGERDGTDGEGEDDEATDDTAPVNPLDVDDTPEEAMERDTQIQLRQIIEELNDSDLETDFFTSFFIENFENIVHFYMLFTKYGPYSGIDRPDKKKEVRVEVACAYMMMERSLTRFTILAKAIGYSEQGLIRRALFFIETYKGEDFAKGAYLIPIYSRALRVGSNFIEPMTKVWAEIAHPRGALRDRVTAYIVAYADLSGVKITQKFANEATGASRSTLSSKVREYKEVLSTHLNL